MLSNFAAARAFVEYGFAEQALGHRQSVSGPGSEPSAAAPALALLDRIIGAHSIRTILDLGCGDWSWMRYGSWLTNPGVRYEGWEAHPRLVEYLITTFPSDRLTFKLGDLTCDPFPPADLVICRDVMFHLPIAATQSLLARLRAVGCLLLATSFLDEQGNIDIEGYLPIDGWGFYRINLDIAPFDLAASRLDSAWEPECTHYGSRRYACLYDLRTARHSG